MLARATLAFAFCLTALGATSQAAELPVPTVEYSADRIMETDAGTFQGKVYGAKDKERSETTMQGMSTVMILRRDKQLGWMLMPAQKMYRQMDLASAQKQSGSPGEQVDISEVGSETLEGHETTKYKLVLKDGSAGGFMWITREGILMKMDAVQKSGRKKTRMTLTLTNLQIGPQDPALFELPAGYAAMPSFGGMSGLSGLGGSRRGGVFGQ